MKGPGRDEFMWGYAIESGLIALGKTILHALAHNKLRSVDQIDQNFRRKNDLNIKSRKGN